jgi:hypothetical protein
MQEMLRVIRAEMPAIRFVVLPVCKEIKNIPPFSNKMTN